jgi:hypothetical protein
MMKRILIYQCALIAALSLAFLACDNDNETITPNTEPQDTLPIMAFNKNGSQSGSSQPDGSQPNASLDAFHFGSKAIETCIVSVENTTAWEVINSDTSWVIIEKQPDNTLKVRVRPSRSLTKRTATLTIVAANPLQGKAVFTVTQSSGTPKLYVRNLRSIPARHCSENGLWVTGQKGTAVVVADVTKLPDDDYIGTLTSLEKGVHSIDNNGKPYSGGCSADGTIYSNYETRSAVDPGAGKEWNPARYTPYIMRNNYRINLPYPTDYYTSNIVIEGFVPRHMYQGCIPDKMSADGKYIYGRVMNINTGWFAARWTRVGTSNDYTFKELGAVSDGDLNVWDTTIYDFEGVPQLSIEPVSFLCPQNISGLSQYGKYACGHYGSGLGGGGQLFRYDMENDKLELLEANGIALYITDDGTLFDANSKVHKLGVSEPISLYSWLVEKYGEEIAGGLGFASMGSVSADYSTAVLFENQGTNSYIITVEP